MPIWHLQGGKVRSKSSEAAQLDDWPALMSEALMSEGGSTSLTLYESLSHSEALCLGVS
jgi:hypothetical protein